LDVGAAIASADATIAAVMTAAKAVAKPVANAATKSKTNAAAYAAYAAANAADYAANAADYAGYINRFDYENLLLNDIEAIKKNKLDECNHDIGIYDGLWEHFITDLNSINCEYWAELYQEIFDNKFSYNEEELKLRLSVPDEIKARGAEGVAEHMTVLKKQSATDVQRARLILIGSAAAGKTTLARKLKDENAELIGYDSTHGVDRNIELDLNGVITQIWDFGGQVIYHSSHRCFMSKRCIYVLVVNARKNDDYRDITKIKYWLDTVQDYAKNETKVFIVINEEDNRKYNFDDISKSLTADYGNLIYDKIYSFNIGSDKKSLLDFKNKLSEYIESKGRQKIGASDKKALDEIKSLFEKGTKLLEKGTAYKILDKYSIEDKERALDLFDTLGVALSYENFDDFVIDPYWISHGIYKVIDYMQNPEFKQPIYDHKFREIFMNELNNYPQDKLKYIFELMERHKIGFRNSGVKGLFVPCVAAFYKPVGTTKPDLDNYIVKFNRDKLKEFPAGFFDKFVADNAKDMNKRDGTLEFWQTGMVLINNKTNALVEIIENREIVITAWGNQKEQYADNLIGCLDKLLKEFSYVAIGKEEIDSISGNPRKTFSIYSEKDEIIEKVNTVINRAQAEIKPYVINGNERLQNVQIVNINIYNGKFQFGHKNTMDDYSVTNNFHNCAINLQGELNTLARSLQTGKQEPDDDAKELLQAAEEIEQVQELIPKTGDEIPAEIKTEVQKKGLLNRLKYILDDLNDENSALHKKASKIKRGIETAQKIAKQYNDIAQWFGLPQVPRPFLGDQ
jgi:internalin A